MPYGKRVHQSQTRYAAVEMDSISRRFPAWLDFGRDWADFVGGLLVGGGIILMILAILEFRKHQTTPAPHQTLTRMITSGIFSRSCNPIYLGYAMVLAGLIFRWDAVLAYH